MNSTRNEAERVMSLAHNLMAAVVARAGSLYSDSHELRSRRAELQLAAQDEAGTLEVIESLVDSNELPSRKLQFITQAMQELLARVTGREIRWTPGEDAEFCREVLAGSSTSDQTTRQTRVIEKLERRAVVIVEFCTENRQLTSDERVWLRQAVGQIARDVHALQNGAGIASTCTAIIVHISMLLGRLNVDEVKAVESLVRLSGDFSTLLGISSGL